MTSIDIYSGFLGAGKTTLIKKMIAEAYAGKKLVLIENEFGEIGVDGGFLQEAGIEITEMNSGCICCSLVGDFERALREVIERYDPERIIIEPSGVGKLSDVVSAVSKVIGDTVSLGHLVAVVDASKCKMYMKNFGEFYNNQIETAKTILLSRTDSMSQEKLTKCAELIREKNPSAVLVSTPWPQLHASQILQAMEQGDTMQEELSALAHEHEHHHHHHDEACCCHEHEHEHEHHHHHDGECCGHGHHHHDGECCGHGHHHHDGECCGHGHHHHDGECCGHGHHHHDGECCGHDHEHHHHHHADEVFTSWGVETVKKFTEEELAHILHELEHTHEYGTILRAKGYVAACDGEQWLHFDFVPQEHSIRRGGAMLTGRLCIIGVELNEDAICALLGVQ